MIENCVDIRWNIIIIIKALDIIPNIFYLKLIQFGLRHTYKEITVFRYKEEKAKLLAEIEENEATKKQTMLLVESRGQLFLKVRSALQQLAEQLRNVSSTPNQGQFKSKSKNRSTYGEIAPTIKPEAVEANGKFKY